MSFNAPVGKHGRPPAARDFLRLLVNYAVLAPSGHNTQPWRFRVRDSELQLLADRTRALPVVDPHDRELTISCGAALDHLAVAARRFGRDLRVTTLPGNDPDHLATVRLHGEVTPGQEDIDLFEAIPRRRTTRAIFEKHSIPNALIESCRVSAERLGTELTIVCEPSLRSGIADLVARGDRVQFNDPHFRQELAAWVRSHRSATNDGMSGKSFGMPDLLSPLGALVIRTFDLGNGIAAGDRKKIVDGSPTLAVFSTAGDTAADWIATGRALSRVLLTLTASGATASYLNQPIEVDALRPRLGALIGTAGTPQLLLRFGYGEPAPATARRPVEEVLIPDDP